MRRITSTHARRAGRRARTDAAADGPLVLDAVPLPHGRLELLGDATGAIWTLTFDARGDYPAQTLELGLLRNLPMMQRELACAIGLYCASVQSTLSRMTMVGTLRSGLLRFLAEEGFAERRLRDVDGRVLTRFAEWLDRPADGKAPMAVRSRIARLRSVKALLRAAVSRPDLTGVSDMPVMPDGPRAETMGDAFDDPAGLQTKTAAIRTILKTVAADATRTMGLVDDLLGQVERREPTTAAGRAALRVADAMRAAAEAGRPLVPEDLLRGIPAHHRPVVRLALLPARLKLMPFLMLLLHYTTWNQATLLNMKIGGIRRIRFAGISRVVITARKRRRGTAASDKVCVKAFAIDEQPTNPSRLLAFVERWTSVMREALGTDHVWIAAGRGRVRLMSDELLSNSRLSIDAGIYLRRAGADGSTLKDIRSGVLDLVHLATGGDVGKVAWEAEHQPQTTVTHYTLPAASRRETVALAGAQAEMQRWISSAGKVDARLLPSRSDRSAATPGFGCMSPTTSPMPGQRDGQPCTAFGRCPACPLAVVDTRSERSCAYLLMLHRAIRTSFSHNDAMEAGAFIGRWGPVAKALEERWLPRFPAQVAQRAKLLDLPDLELD